MTHDARAAATVTVQRPAPSLSVSPPPPAAALSSRSPLDDFEALVRTRRAVRHFRPDPLPPGVLERLLDCARWAPSGYNLQPTRMVVVTRPEVKQALFAACMEQRQVLEAPVVTVFLGDRRVYHTHFERVLGMERDNGSITPEYEARLRQFVPLAFHQGPLGLGWVWKAALLPLLRLVRPLPHVAAVHKSHWLTKQVSLAAMNFMLAAQAAGLATVPMEGFDERRVRRVLRAPRWLTVMVVIPVGFAADASLSKTRVPLADLVHYERWGGGDA